MGEVGAPVFPCPLCARDLRAYQVSNERYECECGVVVVTCMPTSGLVVTRQDAKHKP